jgi:hypothetical protein
VRSRHFPIKASLRGTGTKDKLEQSHSEDRGINVNHDDTSDESERRSAAEETRARRNAIQHRITHDDDLDISLGKGSSEVASRKDVTLPSMDERASVAENHDAPISTRGEIPRTKFISGGHRSGYSSVFSKKGFVGISCSFAVKHVVTTAHKISSDEYGPLYLAFDRDSNQIHLFDDEGKISESYPDLIIKPHAVIKISFSRESNLVILQCRSNALPPIHMGIVHRSAEGACRFVQFLALRAPPNYRLDENTA